MKNLRSSSYFILVFVVFFTLGIYGIRFVKSQGWWSHLAGDPKKETNKKSPGPIEESGKFSQGLSTIGSAVSPPELSLVVNEEDDMELDLTLQPTEKEQQLESLKEKLEQALRIRDKAEKTAALIDIALTMAKQYPDEALGFLNSADISQEDMFLIGDTIVVYLYEKDPETASAWIQNVDDIYLKIREFKHIAEKWTVDDFDEALTWSDSLDDLSSAIAAKSGIAKIWGEDDFETAEKWAREIEHPIVQGAVMRTIGFALSNKSPQDAAEWTMNIVPNISTRVEILESVIPMWSKNDPEGVTRWIEQLNDQETQDILVGMHATKLAETDPVAAANWVLEFPESEIRNNNLVPVLYVFADTEPERAALWANDLPESPLRHSALHQTTSIWAQYDPEAAREWVNQLPDQKNKDRLIRGIAQVESMIQ